MPAGKRTTIEEMIKAAKKDPLFKKMWDERILDRVLSRTLLDVRTARKVSMARIIKKIKLRPGEVFRIEQCLDAGVALKTLESYVSVFGCTLELRVKDKLSTETVAIVPCDKRKLKKLDK